MVRGVPYSVTGRAASTCGGMVTWVTPVRSMSAPSPSPDRQSWGRMTGAAPEPGAITGSPTEQSKLNEANRSTPSPSVMPNRSMWSTARLAGPVWVTTTPFGVPVDPEVWMT
ncbi:hypothetical protein SUDANB58_04971 [Streptomyces sp. enrichment culture]